MRSIFIALLLLSATIAYATVTSTIIGPVMYNGSVVAGGTLVIILEGCTFPTVSGGSPPKNEYSLILSESGNIPTTGVVGNDIIYCNGVTNTTYYDFRAYSSIGILLWEKYYRVSGLTWNLNTATVLTNINSTGTGGTVQTNPAGRQVVAQPNGTDLHINVMSVDSLTLTAPPTSSTQAANKGYVDDAISTSSKIAASGSDNYIQFNKNGNLFSDSNFTFNPSTSLFSTSNLAVTSLSPSTGFIGVDSNKKVISSPYTPVNKTGDTMSGTLTIPSGIISANTAHGSTCTDIYTDPTVLPPAGCHVLSHNGMNAYGGYQPGFINGLVFSSQETTQASLTSHQAFIGTEYYFKATSGGVYNFNFISGQKVDYENLYLAMEARTIGEKTSVHNDMYMYSPGDVLPIYNHVEQFAGYGAPGDEGVVGVEEYLRQGSTTTTGTGGVATGTITGISSGTVSYTPIKDENTMGDNRFIRDLGSIYNTGTYSAVVCSGTSPTTCTVTGSGTTWTSIPGFVGTHTTYNNLATGGNLTSNNLVLCPTGGANDGYDFCVPITTGISDTSLTVNLYSSGSAMNTGWPSTIATSGTYAIYRSALPSKVDIVSHTFIAPDTSGLTVGHTFDQVLSYNTIFIGFRVQTARHIGIPYQGQGIDIQNQSTAGAPPMQNAINIDGAWLYAIGIGANGNAGTPLYFTKFTKDMGSNILFDMPYSSSSVLLPFFYLNSAGTARTPIIIYRDASGSSEGISLNGWIIKADGSIPTTLSTNVIQAVVANVLQLKSGTGQPVLVQPGAGSSNDFLVKSADASTTTFSVNDAGYGTFTGIVTSAGLVTTNATIDSNGYNAGAKWLMYNNGTTLYFRDTVNARMAMSLATSTEATTFWGPTISGGTKYTVTGCSATASYGGADTGLITLGANSCTLVITMGGATGGTAPTGWHCEAHDRTTPTLYIGGESSSTTTTASIVIPSGAGTTDLISFSCKGF